MFKCKACDSTELTALGVLGNIVAARCRHCGLDHMIRTDEISDEDVDELVEQIFVDWDSETA